MRALRSGILLLLVPSATVGRFVVACSDEYGVEPADASTEASNDGAGSGDAGGDSYLPTELAYAATSSDLYAFDMDRRTLRHVAPLVGCGNDMFDLALDVAGELFGTGAAGLVRIDPRSGVCTVIDGASYGSGLAFVPVGVLSPTEEILVGISGGTYYRVTLPGGTRTNLGSLGGGFSIRGDLVMAAGGPMFATVTGASCADCLVELNPQTGEITRNLGNAPANAFGLAAFRGMLFAFTSNGIHAIDPRGPTPSVTSVLPTSPNFRGGAASLTIAP